MKFADYVPTSGLAFFAEVALALFVLAFVAIAVELFVMNRRGEIESRRYLPMDAEDSPNTAATSVAEETR